MAKTFREERWTITITPQGVPDHVELTGQRRITDAQGEYAIEPFYIFDRWEDIPPGVRQDISAGWTSYITWVQSRRT